MRRAVHLPANIFLNPNHQCFTQFFLYGTPPTGLRNTNLQNMRYICQERQPPGLTYYASLHDEGRGIPVYSAYVLYGGNINFQAQNLNGWIPTPGNVLAFTKNQKRPRSERVNLHIDLTLKLMPFRLYLTYLPSFVIYCHASRLEA